MNYSLIKIPKRSNFWQKNLFKSLLVIFSSVGVGLVVVFFNYRLDQSLFITWLLLICLVLISFAFLDRRNALSTQNLAPFFGFVVSVRTISIILNETIRWYGFEYYPSKDPLGVINHSLIITIIAVLTCQMGHSFLVGQNNIAQLFPAPSSPIKSKGLTGILWILFTIGLLFQGLLLQSLGGLQFLLENIGVTKDTTGFGLLFLLGNLPMVAVLISYFRGKSYKTFLLKIIVGLFLAIFLYIMGRRANVLPLFLFAIFAYHYKYKRIKFATWVILALIAYIFLAYLVLARVYLQYETLQPIILENPVKYYFERMYGDLSIVDAMFAVVSQEDGFGIRPWSLTHWYGIFPYLLPRFLFPWKPTYEPLPRIINYLYINPFVENGVPANFVGTFYLNAGYFGVIIGCILFGYLARVLKEYTEIHNNSNASLFIYSVIFYTMLLFIRNGDFTNIITMALTQFGALIVLVAFSLGLKVFFVGINSQHTNNRVKLKQRQ